MENNGVPGRMTKGAEATARYRRAHRAEVNERERVRRQTQRDAAPTRPCECGCGMPAKRRFISGHNLERAPDDGLTYAQRVYRKHRARRLAETKAYTEKHREERRAYARTYHAKHRQKANAKRLASARANPEREKARKRAWELANPERVRLLRKRSNLRNPDNYRARVANANHRRRAVTGDGVNPTEWRSIREAYGFRCAYCGAQRKTFTQDHVEPISNGGTHSPENVVPACPRCNCSKGAHPILVWVAMYGMPT